MVNITFIKYAFLFFFVRFLGSCNNETHENNEGPIDETFNDSSNMAIDSAGMMHTENYDTTFHNETSNDVLLSVDDWNLDDFIVNKEDRSSESLKRTIDYEREEWKGVKSPFIATYRGCDFGDYFHLTFEDAHGKIYDFGFGENNYGEYELFDNGDYTDNPAYLNKPFNVYWNWVVSSFPCCDGEYEMVEAYLPSITKLELIDAASTKK